MGYDEHGPAYPEPRCPRCSQERVACLRDDCPRRNPLPPHVPENVEEFHRRISAQHEYVIYRCPICNGGKNRYMTCDYPGCPDGCDQPRETYAPGEVKCAACLFMSTLLIIAFVGALLFACVRPAAAFDHGFDKSTPRSKFFAQLLDHSAERLEAGLDADAKLSWFFTKLLRQDKLPDPCCGKADAYEADIFKRNPKTAIEPWGSYDVVITNGEDEHPWPDGTHRTPIKNGTRVHVPGNKINPPSETKNNPTGHSWLFVATKRDTNNVVTPGTEYCFAPLPEGS